MALAVVIFKDPYNSRWLEISMKTNITAVKGYPNIVIGKSLVKKPEYFYEPLTQVVHRRNIWHNVFALLISR